MVNLIERLLFVIRDALLRALRPTFYSILEVTCVELCNDIRLIIFKLPPQVFHALVLVRAPIAALEVATETRGDQQARYLLILWWCHRDGLEHLPSHFIFELGDIVD